MIKTIRELIKLAFKSKKVWIIPVVLTFIIVALLVISSQVSPVPIFLYPIM